MSTERIPVLWLCGPPGVGKTAAGWELYSQLDRGGVEAGYVDIDQLGMCYPEPASDPGRHWMKTRNLNAVAAGFQAAGARCVVVSGVVDAAQGVPMDEIPLAALTVCRLRADPEQLTQRFVTRRGSVEGVEQVLREAEDLDASTVADVCVDTGGLSVTEVARQLRERVADWPPLTSRGFSLAATCPTEYEAKVADGPILWLCGPTAIGKSSVGFRVYQKLLRAGLTAAYIDVDQVGFCSPSPADHRLRAHNLAAMWHTYRSVDAQALVAVGPVHNEPEISTYADALPAATFTWCRLQASRNQLTRRIMSRGRGGSWSQPGDPLKGQSTAWLLRIADRAVADAAVLDSAPIGLPIDTNERTAEEVADAILCQSGWPGALA